MPPHKPLVFLSDRFEQEPDETSFWTLVHCYSNEPETSSGGLGVGTLGQNRIASRVPPNYSPDWAQSVPELLAGVVSLLSEKRKQELRFNFLQVTLGDFEKRIRKLECSQARIVPIDTFAPESYNLLKPILVSVQSVEDGFSAGWFDANIHFSGDNEEEAVSNLKSLILEFFKTFSSEPAENLGPEPTRQLAVMKEYIQMKP